MRYPLEKYKYIFHTRKDGVNEIAAVSSYSGRYVKAVAKCSPGDNYDEETGKKLAAARCNLKVASKRVRNAKAAYKQAMYDYDKAAARLNDMQQYVVDANRELREAEEFLNDIIEGI